MSWSKSEVYRIRYSESHCIDSKDSIDVRIYVILRILQIEMYWINLVNSYQVPFRIVLNLKTKRSRRQTAHVLSKRIFPSWTDWYTVYPMEEQAERRDVPRFILEKLEHLIPKWEAKQSSMHLSKASTASLGCLRRVYHIVFDSQRFKRTKSSRVDLLFRDVQYICTWISKDILVTKKPKPGLVSEIHVVRWTVTVLAMIQNIKSCTYVLTCTHHHRQVPKPSEEFHPFDSLLFRSKHLKCFGKCVFFDFDIDSTDKHISKLILNWNRYTSRIPNPEPERYRTSMKWEGRKEQKPASTVADGILGEQKNARIESKHHFNQDLGLNHWRPLGSATHVAATPMSPNESWLSNFKNSRKFRWKTHTAKMICKDH